MYLVTFLVFVTVLSVDIACTATQFIPSISCPCSGRLALTKQARI